MTVCAMKPANLALEDGTVFAGRGFGAYGGVNAEDVESRGPHDSAYLFDRFTEMMDRCGSG